MVNWADLFGLAHSMINPSKKGAGQANLGYLV